MYIYYIF